MSPVDDRLKRALEGSYTVLHELGRGATSTVYLAKDLKHRRHVAIKVLHPEIAAMLGTDRFRREIEISAHLEHPHILTLIDSGEADGLLYYIMPRVEGESLGDRLEREGKIPVGEAVRIAREVADGLAYAHERDVIHRDVKPGNILLTDSHALIADFGIAKALRDTMSGKVTRTGMTVGSPAYMSPEQVLGAQDLDGRTDIYSLGSVLYEMIAGVPPSKGATMAAIFAHRMSEEPLPLSHVVDGVPVEVEEAVQRALARDPNDRFDTADQFAAALVGEPLPAAAAKSVGKLGRRSRLGPSGELAEVGKEAVGAASTRRFWLALAVAGLALAVAVIGRTQLARWAAPLLGRQDLPTEASPDRLPLTALDLDPRRIAVLYFDDMSESGDFEPYANGLTEWLIQELSQVDALEVISRNGVKPYRNVSVTVDSIVRALRPGTLVGGSVAVGSDRIRVNVQLIDAATNAHIDSRTLERPRGELIALLDDLSEEVSVFLRERLGEEIRFRTARAGTDQPEAWELVQRAASSVDLAKTLASRDDLDGARAAYAKADSMLARAESIDRDWIEPAVRRGWVAFETALLGKPRPSGAGLDSMLALAERALERASDDPKALELRGTARLYLGWQERDPDLAAAHYASAQTDLDEAVTRDPTLARAWAELSHVYSRTGHYEDAAWAAESALEADAFLEQRRTVIVWMARTALNDEDIENARYWTRRGLAMYPDDRFFAGFQLLMLAIGEAQLSDVEEAWGLVDILKRRFADVPGDPPVRQMLMAGVLARAGLEDSARSVIRRAREAGSENSFLFYNEAVARLALGDRDTAILRLAEYLEAEPTEKASTATDWLWRPLSDDPAFQAIVAEGE